MYFTITFRSFTPQPGGLEFKPGHDYYFITTSTGRAEGLHRRYGGRCASRHMKVTFKVCCKDGHGETGTEELSPSVVGTNTTSTALKSTINGDSVQPPKVILDSTTYVVNHSTPSTTLKPVIKSDIHTLLRVARPTAVPVADEAASTHRMHVVSSSTIPTASASTPFWWRPNYTKLPTVRQGQDAMAGSAASDSESSTNGQSNGKKGRAWLLVVAAGIAVGVACLIVCGLGIGRRLFIIDKSNKDSMVSSSTLHHHPHHHHSLHHPHHNHHTLPYPNFSPPMTPPPRLYGDIG